MKSLAGKTILITGASRGIGREMAILFAKDGANIVVAAKTAEPNPILPGTIHSVAAEVEKAGGKALPFQVDVRSEDEVLKVVGATVLKFGGIDAVINNAGAILLASVEQTPMKRFDLMHQINARAVFMVSQAALPHLKKSENPHILNMSPPLNLDRKWMRNNVGYMMSKYGMTLATLGMAGEFKKHGIAVNSLWPKRIIETAATKMLFQKPEVKNARTPRIMAEAAYAILTSPAKEFTGHTMIDEEVLASKGVTDFSSYAIDPSQEPLEDLFV